MGKLAEKLTSTRVASGRTYTCRVDTICQDDEDRTAVAAVLASSASVRAKARQIGVHEGTLAKHLEKRCQCYKQGN